MDHECVTDGRKHDTQIIAACGARKRIYSEQEVRLHTNTSPVDERGHELVTVGEQDQRVVVMWNPVPETERLSYHI